jgi:taurine ABC transporter substrate-binding protein
MNLTAIRHSDFALRQRKRNRYFSLVGLISVLMILVLSACGGTGAASSSSSKPTVTVGYEGFGGDPETYAIAQGLFNKYMNANVQLKYFDSGPAALAAIASGSLQLMTDIGNAPTASALSTGVALKIVYAQSLATTGEGLVIRNGSGINSVKDLKGKKIAVVRGSSSDFELNAVLTKNGVNPSDVTKLNMATSSMPAAWNNHSIDAVYVWNPQMSALVNSGGKVLATDEDVIQTAPTFNLVLANGGWAQSNPKLVQGFLQAQDQALIQENQNPDKALQVLSKQSGVPADQVKSQMAGNKFYRCAGTG